MKLLKLYDAIINMFKMISKTMDEKLDLEKRSMDIIGLKTGNEEINFYYYEKF